MPEFNSMQLNLGMGMNNLPISNIPTPTPAQTSARLMQEANQRAIVSNTILQQSGGVVPDSVSAFSRQFQEQFQAIQSRQSYDPILANQMMGGIANAYMPSPLLMTPAETGVFRPPAPPPIAMVPPIQIPRQQWSPFTPQLPSPMFRTPYEQEQLLEDYRANRQFGYMSQIPSIVGTGVGLGAGALAGARLGRSFGARGRLIGAVGGAALSGLSGFAGGVGDLFQLPMRPAIQRREMGAALQNITRNWVVSGPQLHGLGRGLSRDASIQLAEDIQDLVSNRRFQQETGEMFNQRDLMTILRRGGQEGLFDTAQSVPRIRQQLRETANTIKEFMQLTNDPSISNVIREMGRLRQFGLTQQDMLIAAQGMRTFSRAAGTTLRGLQEIGGLPGAMTFQRAGLTAGQGFMYGNYAAASARQMVASGAVNERQLALLGGIQGITQRDIQAQAALNSMPLFAASNMQYGLQGWGVNAANVGQTNRGAFGMVENAVGAMNQAVSRGGLGALTMLPLRQREMADRAAAMLTPQEQRAQRFQLAMQTGERLGMAGESAMAMGARLLYGNEAAEQMLYQARSPEFWRNQREIVRRQRRELYFEQRQKDKDAESMLPEGLRLFGRTIGADKATDAFTGGVRKAWRATRENIESLGSVIASPFRAIDEFIEDEELKAKGIYRRRLGRETGRTITGLQRAIRSRQTTNLRGEERFSPIRADDLNRYRIEGEGIRDPSRQAFALGFENQIGGVTASATIADWAMTPLEKYLEYNPATFLPMLAFKGVTGIDLSNMTANLARNAGLELAALSLSDKQRQDLTDKGTKLAREQLNVMRQARRRDSKLMKEAYARVGGGDTGVGKINLLEMGQNLENIFMAKSTSGDQGIILSDNDYINAIFPVLKEQEGLSEAQAKKRARELLSSSGLKSTLMASMLDTADPENKSIISRELEEEPIGAADSGIGLAGLEAERKRLEEELDFDTIFGGITSSAEKVKDLTIELGGQRVAALAAIAASNRLTGRDRNVALREVQKRYQLNDEELAKLQKRYARMDEDVQGLLARTIEKGGVGAIQTLEDYSKTLRTIGVQEAFKSEGFQRLIGGYSQEAADYLAETRSGITAENLAGRFTEDELKRMATSRSARARKLAKAVRLAQGTGEESRRAQLKLENLAVLESGIDVQGREDVEMRAVEGKEAVRLEKAEDAMAAMEDVANSFAPAVKEFSEGARIFREALELDISISNRE